MDRLGARRRARFQPLPRRLRELRPEPQPQRFAQQVRRHPIEQRVPQPVRLDHLWVEGVGDGVRARDQLQVGVGAFEAAGEMADLPVIAIVVVWPNRLSASSGPHRPSRFGPYA